MHLLLFLGLTPVTNTGVKNTGVLGPKAEGAAMSHVPVSKAAGKAGLILPEDVLIALRITPPPRQLTATALC